ncbi:MAG: LysR family transcriptional regulator [Rhodocyclales bacterium]|nr:LysR family transcriptional regulator [Rhodocyclales bacterium]
MTLPPDNRNLRLPPLAAIRALEAAVRLGSFERASAELNITPSAISKRVAGLEQFVGVRLLDRLRGGVHATTAGLEYITQVRQALALLSSVGLHQRPERPFRSLRICVPPTFARNILIPGLADFEDRYPDIELDIVLSVPYLDIRPPGAHVEILANRHPERGAEILGDEQMRAVCTPAYADHLELASPVDLRRATLIRCPLEPWSPWLDAAGLAWPEPAHGIRFVDAGMSISAAASGLGVVLTRPSLCAPLLQRGELVSPFLIRSRPTTRYSQQINNSAVDRDRIGDAAIVFGIWLSERCRHALTEAAAQGA